MADTPHVDILRSPLGRARGRGAAKHGAGEWVTTRIESAALVPLTVWFVISVIHLSGATQADVILWMSSPYRLVLMLVLIAITFHHLQLGLQNVIEDYIHNDGTKWAVGFLNKAFCVLLGVACIISALKIGL